jgi:DNA-binding winged helix-turn-helix (wHTH) protein
MEQKEVVIAFGPFRLLPAQKQLWKGEERIEIRPMPLAVLAYLVQHPEQVVSVEELHKAIWAGTYVSRTVIRVCIREIRQALSDETVTPRYIETIGRRGYRFIGETRGLRLETSSPSPQVSLSEDFASLPLRGLRKPPVSSLKWSGAGGRGVFYEGDRGGAPPGGEGAGVAGGHEFEPALATAGQEDRGSADAGGDLRLVHRGV